MEMNLTGDFFGTLWVAICVVVVLWIFAMLVWILREWTRRMK